MSAEGNQFVSLDFPDNDSTQMKTAGLDFLPSNYDQEIKSNDNSYNKENQADTVLNFGNLGKYIHVTGDA